MIDIVRDPTHPDWIPWRKPILVTLADGKTKGYGCRICIAAKGLHGSQVEDLPQTPEGFAEHMREAHDMTSDLSGI